MIATPMYKGSGLGNQLANYVAVRSLALYKGYDFGVQFPENFKGHSFVSLDLGLPVVGGRTSVEGQVPDELPEGFTSYYAEPQEWDGTLNITGYDAGFFSIQDNTLIHGLLQGVDYYTYRNVLDIWLKVEPLEFEDNVCVINVRGGEYKGVPSFILPQSYWDNGVAEMLKMRPDMMFEVHTDDPDYARSLFPNFPIIADIGLNWRSIRYAPYLLLSNSSFAILPAYLNKDAYVVAPMYFAGHNSGKWGLEQNKIQGWNYICG